MEPVTFSAIEVDAIVRVCLDIAHRSGLAARIYTMLQTFGQRTEADAASITLGAHEFHWGNSRLRCWLIEKARGSNGSTVTDFSPNGLHTVTVLPAIGGIHLAIARRSSQTPLPQDDVTWMLAVLRAAPWAPSPWSAPRSISSPRQQQVLSLLVDGLPEKHVAAVLGISINTVHTYTKTIYKSLGVCTRAELINTCLRPSTTFADARLGRTCDTSNAQAHHERSDVAPIRYVIPISKAKE